MDNVQPWHQSKPDRKVCLIITVSSLLLGVLLNHFLPAVICLIGSFWFSRQHYWKWVVTSMAGTALFFLLCASGVAILVGSAGVLWNIATGHRDDIQGLLLMAWIPVDLCLAIMTYCFLASPLFLAMICLRRKLAREPSFPPVQDDKPSLGWRQNPRIRTTAMLLFLLLAVFFSNPYYTLRWPPLPIVLATYLIYRKLAGEECFAQNKREEAGRRTPQARYQAKVTAIVLFSMLAAVFFTSPGYRAYQYYYHNSPLPEDMGLLYIITVNSLVTIESLFISQQHYWKWMPLSVLCIVEISFISTKVFFAEAMELSHSAMTTEILYGLINGVVFLLYSIPWLFLLFFIRKQILKVWQGGR